MLSRVFFKLILLDISFFIIYLDIKFSYYIPFFLPIYIFMMCVFHIVVIIVLFICHEINKFKRDSILNQLIAKKSLNYAALDITSAIGRLSNSMVGYGGTLLLISITSLILFIANSVDLYNINKTKNTDEWKIMKINNLESQKISPSACLKSLLTFD